MGQAGKEEKVNLGKGDYHKKKPGSHKKAKRQPV